MNDIIITHYSNVSKQGVLLHTNKIATLKTGNVRGTQFWVSWDKIGRELFDNYTEINDVDDLQKLREKKL